MSIPQLPTPEDLEKRIKSVENIVIRLHRDLTLIKKNPGTWDVMRYYLKGRGHSWTAINNILAGVEEFMQKIMPKKPAK